MAAKTRKFQARKTQTPEPNSIGAAFDERPERLLVSLRPSVWSALSTTTKSARNVGFRESRKQTQIKAKAKQETKRF
jgi:hypothetical protein